VVYSDSNKLVGLLSIWLWSWSYLPFCFLGTHKTHAAHLQIKKHSVYSGHWTLRERRHVRSYFSNFLSFLATNWENSLRPSLLPPS
jgi:hypothetical protein